MKIIFLLIGSFAFIAAKSQGRNGKINNDQFDSYFSAKNPVPAPLIVNAITSLPFTYKMLFETDKGKVYQSAVDKMKCLAVDFPSRMPVAGILKSVPEHIPNPMLNKGILPKPLK